ncbi:MAG: phage tail tape measure protein [Syntrophorhabdus sp.]|nr:phage tail tape measure protein [Syntrophorhabdus sp.]
MSSKNVLELILSGNSSKLLNALGIGEKGLRKFGHTAKQEFDRIRSAATSVEGKLASLGMSIGAGMLVKQSAQMDKVLTQIGQTAGATKGEVQGLRKELFRMSSETGQSVEDLQQGFNNAVQAGLNFKEALPVIEATNKAMAVTGANADRLTSGLTVAATAFQFDLSKPSLALSLLDKMTTAGRLGNAELQNLSDIFARVGVNASRAGMGFDQTLAFIEGLSLIEKQPERLATLADSTLRLFTNLNYMKQAQKTTGVKFFDASGERRNPLEILADIKKKYDALETTVQRETFMSKALKGADLDTIKGMQTLLKGDMLGKISGEFLAKIGQAAGTINNDLDDAINNAIDQTGRLKARMREAADDFAKPVKEAITYGIKRLLNKKKNSEDWAVDYDTGTPGGVSGLGLSGKQLVGGGIAALGAGYAAYRFGGPLAKKLLGRLGGSAAGIAEGKAVEATTGVTPVFVTNWPAGGLGGAASDIPGASKAGSLIKKALPFAGKGLAWLTGGAGALASTAGLAAAASGTALYSAYDIARGGSGKNWISNTFDSAIQALFNDNKSLGDRMYDWLNKEGVKNTINISVDKDGRVTTNSDNMNTQVNTSNHGYFP